LKILGHLELINRQLSYDLDGWFNKYNKPMIVSEYGADTISVHDDPSVMVNALPKIISKIFLQFTEEYQVDFMTEYHKVFNNKSQEYLIGELIWNFADFRTGQSGN
jgi:beta-glucuronidase